MNTSSGLRTEPWRFLSAASCLIFLLFSQQLWPGSAFAQVSVGTPLTTFTNPTPAGSDFFAVSVGAVGNDRVLVGKRYGGIGAAYLFNIEGDLLTTFTNPAPQNFYSFGASVAAMGADKVIIGAVRGGLLEKGEGAAYLFSANAELITVFTNPTPLLDASFGYSVAAVGEDRVLVGELQDSGPDKGIGAAYLFSTNGALLTTFTNPNPLVSQFFGVSVAALNSNLVVIGSPMDFTDEAIGGAAYLFNTSGALLTKVTNPGIDFDFFGLSVAAIGNHHIPIGAPSDNTSRNAGGAAYLFGTNGILITIFTNPTPANFDQFGFSVAAVGSDRVLIGAHGDDNGMTDVGAAYLFSTNGTLLASFTNPTPAVNDQFGFSVAALGNDRVLIGALQNDTGATDAGAAYLFSIPHPPLNITLSASTVSVKWVWPETGLILQQAGLLGPTADWKDAAESVSVSGQTNLVQQSLAGTNRFYRLRKP